MGLIPADDFAASSVTMSHHNYEIPHTVDMDGKHGRLTNSYGFFHEFKDNNAASTAVMRVLEAYQTSSRMMAVGVCDGFSQLLEI